AWSIGWRWHPSQRLDLDRIAQWLAQWPWQRAKLVIHGGNGWQSANAIEGQALAFRPSEWRRDSRLELIFSEPQDQLELERGLQACRIAD
ncbi:MAG TPA: cobalamin biosynthesis protein CobW, partial [Pseudomonas sp.]|nr:cobalamin biosynthesis protein CobW [Pseudomonas sp.]